MQRFWKQGRATWWTLYLDGRIRVSLARRAHYRSAAQRSRARRYILLPTFRPHLRHLFYDVIERHVCNRLRRLHGKFPEAARVHGVLIDATRWRNWRADHHCSFRKARAWRRFAKGAGGLSVTHLDPRAPRRRHHVRPDRRRDVGSCEPYSNRGAGPPFVTDHFTMALRRLYRNAQRHAGVVGRWSATWPLYGDSSRVPPGCSIESRRARSATS